MLPQELLQDFDFFVGLLAWKSAFYRDIYHLNGGTNLGKASAPLAKAKVYLVIDQLDPAKSGPSNDVRLRILQGLITLGEYRAWTFTTLMISSKAFNIIVSQGMDMDGLQVAIVIRFLRFADCGFNSSTRVDQLALLYKDYRRGFVYGDRATRRGSNTIRILIRRSLLDISRQRWALYYSTCIEDELALQSILSIA